MKIHPRPSASSSGSTGSLLELIRRSDGLTRADLVLSTGMGRSTVTQRLEPLLAAGLVVDGGEARSTGGRPPALLRFNPDAGVVLVADLGATHARFGVTDLAAEILAEQSQDLLISSGPEAVLGAAQQVFDELLVTAGKTIDDVRGIGIGVPGPVDFVRGTAVDPPIMPGWGNFAIRTSLEERYGVGVFVDNDVNIMALGEFWAAEAASGNSVFLKVGTGIGSGLLLDGRLYRGANGAAGDIGHIEGGRPDVTCRCGNSGCLEANASGSALAEQLAELGHDTKDGRDVVALANRGDRDALNAVREAGRLIGGVLAGVVNLINPAEVVIGGDLAEAGQPLLAGIRETV
jgi:predicted NBD/HSP70 family sugar kinase